MKPPTYEVFAIRYARRDAQRREHFVGGDPHDAPMPMDYFVWLIRNAERTIVVDTGFAAEVAAKRKLEDSGYRDMRSMTANPDGTFSGKATRADPPGGVRRGSNPEVNVEIDASGNVRER